MFGVRTSVGPLVREVSWFPTSQASPAITSHDGRLLWPVLARFGIGHSPALLCCQALASFLRINPGPGSKYIFRPLPPDSPVRFCLVLPSGHRPVCFAVCGGTDSCSQLTEHNPDIAASSFLVPLHTAGRLLCGASPLRAGMRITEVKQEMQGWLRKRGRFGRPC